MKPLPPATLNILLALAAQEMHGYAIMQEVLRQSDGAYKIGPGTLYDNLQRLMDKGLVKEADAPAGAEPRRRAYRLTPTGRKALAAEIDRLEGVVREARRHLLQPKRSS